MEKIPVYIEIEKYSNIKYEYNKLSNKLCVDRILPYPYFYPYAYGFIQDTKACDDDELDVCIISDIQYKNDILIEVYIIGGLVMEDEKGMDEKIFVIPVHEYELLENQDIEKIITEDKLENISWFFSNYKNKTKDRWSKVYKFMSKNEAHKLYEDCKKRYLEK